ncbi:hypothetical protein HYW54_02880 [Candidatus Gottesmanbacteria bacterium]|nr:hypothetical protein [Candidatus Gottesmanbacteria bacterium]
MAEIRKIIREYDKPVHHVNLLLIFCDWALHYRMDRSGAQEIINLFVAFLQGLNPFLSDVVYFAPEEIFTILKKQFSFFLKKYKLPNNLVTDDSNWKMYLFNLLSVISECSLSSNSKRIRQIKIYKSGSKYVYEMDFGSATQVNEFKL